MCFYTVTTLLMCYKSIANQTGFNTVTTLLMCYKSIANQAGFTLEFFL